MTQAHTNEAIFDSENLATALPYYVLVGEERLIGFSALVHGAMKYSSPQDATVLFKDNEKNFTDSSKHWAKADIDFVTARDLLIGTGEH